MSAVVHANTSTPITVVSNECADDSSSEQMLATQWNRMLTLQERLELLPTLRVEITNPQRVAEELSYWKSLPPFKEADAFAAYLDSLRVTERQFRQMLAMSDVETILKGPDKPVLNAWRLLTEKNNDRSPPQEMHPFMALVWPLVEGSEARLQRRLQSIVQRYPDWRIQPEALSTLRLAFANRLLGRAFKTCVLELNVARVEGRLAGKNSRARFRSYIALLASGQYRRQLFAEYPVLLRQLAQFAATWVCVQSEMLERLAADAPLLRKAFHKQQPLGAISGFVPDLGDPHRGGRSVAFVEFECGLRLVYKPRSMDIDVRFGEFVRWCNEKASGYPLRVTTVVDRGDYGWMEYCAPRACQSTKEIERFYWRIGAYLAIFHALAGTDFHSENVIAAGEQPIFVDLEVLFNSGQRTAHDGPSGFELPATILATGLLPQRIWGNEKTDGIDISGIFAAGGQEIPEDLWQPQGDEDDCMRMAPTRAVTPRQQNRPSVDGKSINAKDYHSFIRDGFTCFYQLLLQQRDEIAAPDGPLAAFNDTMVRRVLRPTRAYSTLIRSSFHPDYLRDGMQRSELWEHLRQGHEDSPATWALNREIQDMESTDVPAFGSCVAGCDLSTSAGKTHRGFFAKSGADFVRQRVLGFSEGDLAAQLWLLEASLDLIDEPQQKNLNRPNRINKSAHPGRQGPLACACDVGDRLCDIAFQKNGCAFWSAPVLEGEQGVRCFSPGLATLYDGELGIALFLAYLHQASGSRRYATLARQALQSVRSRLSERHPVGGSGFFAGLAGYVYVMVHLGHVLDDSDLLDEARGCLDRLSEALEATREFDVVNGAAGTILGLAAVDDALQSHQGLQRTIDCCARRLVTQARPQLQGGVAWQSSKISHGEVSHPPLTGFSHGAAGCMAALMVADRVLQKTDFQPAAMAGWEYEKAQFCETVGNWPDFRNLSHGSSPGNGSHSPVFQVTWCHGAPGIGIGRILMARATHDPALRRALLAETRTAVNTTLASDWSFNHSLCHGTLGNLDFLLLAAEALHDASLRKQTASVGGKLLAALAHGPWRSGLGLLNGRFSEREVPGLMTGLAGIGYGLLRLADPKAIPSVLAFEAPAHPNTHACNGRLPA